MRLFWNTRESERPGADPITGFSSGSLARRAPFPLVMAILGTLLLTPATHSQAPLGFVVIANKANKFDSIGRAQLKTIFLRKVSRWPWGAEAVPVDLPARFPLCQLFAEKILDNTIEGLAVYWIDQKITRNTDPPARAASVAEVKVLVASRPGAISYVPAEAVDATVKVLAVK